MSWWQVALIVFGAISIGLAVGYLLNKFVSGVIPAFQRRRKTARKTPSQIVKSSPEHSPPLSNFITELNYNWRLSNTEWKGDLKPFQTSAWDNRGDEVHSLPAELRNELNEAYSDMALANSITWLSTEMERRSPSLDESYSRLRKSISERLNRIKPQLDNNSPTSQSTHPQRAS